MQLQFVPLLCHFVCHLGQFSDNIFKIHVHIRNQLLCHRLYMNFETNLCNFDVFFFIIHLKKQQDIKTTRLINYVPSIVGKDL